MLSPHDRNYRLSFLMPEGERLLNGVHAPAVDGCVVTVSASVLVEIQGPSRQAVFDHAALLLRVVRRRYAEPFALAARLVTPPPSAGRDAWTIIVGAEIAFSPTGLDPQFPRLAVHAAGQPPPGTTVRSGGLAGAMRGDGEAAGGTTGWRAADGSGNWGRGIRAGS